MNWFKCNVCSKPHYGPQKTINEVQVCPHCDSANLIIVSADQAMTILLPWRNTNV